MGTYDGLPKALLQRGQLLPMLAGLLVLSAMFGATFHKVSTLQSEVRALSSTLGQQRASGRLQHHGRAYSVESVSNDLRELYKSNQCMPLMLRLAWHDAGTYSKWDKTGGANGSIRFPPEREHPANAGLRGAMDLLEPIKAKHHISYADLYQLAAYVGVQVAGGPEIPFRAGRPDAYPSETTPDGRLPDAAQGREHLRDVFYRMGFTDREVVALSGAHTLGRGHKDRSGHVGPWTERPLEFSNDYFELLLEGGRAGLLALPTDKALLNSKEMRTWVQAYADDKALFFEDFAAAVQEALGAGGPVGEAVLVRDPYDKALFFEDFAAAFKKLSELGVQW
eukprot:CAMPEP_0182859256 /NCGR_PEP_ID=MMETSP0034_2-20130328/4181_1 /TAXON_ID=156128 /ORGANISM="Nephroselmis pyriformis, Strain CCMP717" /LENGTH=336 /DNA_ID=CAMNT_0024990827 /DNA_START=108 /DNA_END=1114 /DNA_ORIENTATION=+